MQIIDLFEVRDLRKRVGSYWTHDESFGYYVTLITYTRNKYDRLIGIDPYVKHESTEIAALRSYIHSPHREQYRREDPEAFEKAEKDLEKWNQ